MTTRTELLSIAQEAAGQQGWPWLEPVSVTKLRRWILFGPVEWQVMTNTNFRGGNIFVVIDDRTKKVLRRGYSSR